MKLLTFLRPRTRTPHLGALLSTGQVLDLPACPSPSRMPMTLLDCIRGGDSALRTVRDAVAQAEDRVKRTGAAEALHALEAVRILPPLRPGKIMAMGRNYGEHVREMAGKPPTRPAGFIKLVSSIVGQGDTVLRPPWTEKLDYETELAVVIGRDCLDIPEDRVYDYVFGYTIMNDISARDIQAEDAVNGSLMVGKSFPTSAPLGPWVVTRDEIPDPHDLHLVTRVNGEVRQDANTGDMIHKIPSQLAWFSHAGFQAGDIVSTGTPSGVAAGYRGPGSWWLKHGDVLESELEKIGTLRNIIQDRPGF